MATIFFPRWVSLKTTVKVFSMVVSCFLVKCLIVPVAIPPPRPPPLNPTTQLHFYQGYQVLTPNANGSNSKVTFFLLKKCSTRWRYVRLLVHKRDNSSRLYTKPVLKTVNAQCPWLGAPKCSWGGFTMEFNIKETPSEFYYFEFDTIRSGRQLPKNPIIRVVDVPAEARPHPVGLCVQPIFLYSDWVQLIRFFSLWKEMGAGIAIVYYQSATNYVRDILKMYEAAALTKVISWPMMIPAEGYADPNAEMYRAEMFTSINDCLFRMRHFAGMAVFVDLDEFIMYDGIENGRTFPDYIYALDKDKNAGAYLFRSSIARPTNLQMPEKLTDFNFNDFHSIQISNFTFQSGKMSKIVARPEKVKQLHIHQVLKFHDKNDEHHFVDEESAGVLHFRRVQHTGDGRFPDSGWHQSSALKLMAQRAQKQLRLWLDYAYKYLETRPFPATNPYENSRAMQKCLDFYAQQRPHECPAAHLKCRTFLKNFKTEDYTISEVDVWTAV